MKLFDALAASPVRCAKRAVTDGPDERDAPQPNIVLDDNGAVKAFRAVEDLGWQRRKLNKAKEFTDWIPANTRLYDHQVDQDCVTFIEAPSLEDVRRDFEKDFPSVAPDLVARRMACFPEPPPDERFRYVSPFSLMLIVEDPETGMLRLRSVMVSSQDELDAHVEFGQGLSDCTVRRQLSIMCDRMPEAVGLFL